MCGIGPACTGRQLPGSAGSHPTPRPPTACPRCVACLPAGPAGCNPATPTPARLPALPVAARAEEPQRYAALVQHLAAQWRRDKAALGVAAAAEATLPYVPLAKWWVCLPAACCSPGACCRA